MHWWIRSGVCSFDRTPMFYVAALNVFIVFAGILLYIWRLQFVFPDFALNRLLAIFRRSNHAAWASAAVFAVFHIPNPILVPVTFFGGYILARVFITHRNLVPLAISQAVIGL